MSTVIESSPAIEQAKQYTTMCKGRLLKTFSFVPDDKLNWSPSPTTNSALRIVAHCGIANGNFIGIIQGGKMPDMTREQMMEHMHAAESALTTREQAVALIEESSAAVLAAIDELTPEQVGSMVSTPFFDAPMVFWMNLPGRHMDNHASQIDLLQTCWGDVDWHM